MAFTCPQEFIDLAHTLADAARPIALHYFRSNSLTVDDKGGELPVVTIADREIEETWRNLIHKHRPQDAIWGEEYGRENEQSELTWIFDPIDGTLPFTMGRATFGHMIGLHHREHGFIAGIVDQSVVGMRWVGILNGGATLNGKTLRTRQPAGLHDVRISMVNPLRLTPDLRALHDQLLPKTRFISYGGDCMNYVGIADGSLHVNFDSQQKIYDIAAAIPIIREAGGVITHKDGNPIELTADHTVMTACTPELHAQVLEMYRKVAA